MIPQPNLSCHPLSTLKSRTNRRRGHLSLAATLALASALVCASLPQVGRAGAGKALPSPGGDINAAVPAGAFEEEFVPGELLVAFRPSAARGKVEEARASVGASVVRELPEIRVQHWRLGAGSDVARAVQALSSNPNVRYAEPNYLVSANQLPASPADAYRSDLWGLHNLGQSGGAADADIDAPEAWAVHTGSPGVVIGVIDSGIDYNHPDLQNNIWVNQNEVPGNGVDDDGNGYVDDARGWDFVNNDNDPLDDYGHGTHVAGTVGAEGNNSAGVVGVNWHTQLMPLKFLDAAGNGSVANAAAAILYAAKFKDAGGANLVRVTCNSWTGPKRSSAVQDAIANSGALFVAAAGNNGSSQAVYPAGYPNDNIISVAATDHADNLASFSNFNSSWVDLGAPGVNILSTIPGGQYGSKDGTSMATPHVAGVAGLILSASPGLSVSAVKARILGSVDAVPALAGKTLTGGRLNAGRALNSTLVLSDDCDTAQTSCAPAGVTDLSVDSASATPDSVTLRWTATGDDGAAGAAYLYDVRYSTSAIDAGNFAQAAVANREPVPGLAGSTESFTVTGLKPNTAYHFAVRVSDEVGNYSGLAVASGSTAQSPWPVTVIQDNNNNLGFYVSLAYDSSSRPSVGYSDETADDVKLARWDGSGWSIQTVDPGTDVRTGVSLAYDPANNPTLTYGWGKLYFAQLVPATQTWQRTLLEGKNAYNDVTSLVYDPNGNPSVSYRTATSGGRGSLRFARKTGAGWTIQTVAAAGARYSSLAYDGAGNPTIAYSDDANGDGTLDTLRFARWDGSKWVIQTVETGVNGYGVLASLAFDAAGRPAIAHVSGGAVRFVRWNGTSWGPAENVGTGSHCSLTFSASDGNYYLSYGDANGLWLAKRDVGGWSTELIDAGVRERGYTSLAISPCGTPSVAYSTYPNNDLRFVSGCPLP